VLKKEKRRDKVSRRNITEEALGKIINSGKEINSVKNKVTVRKSNAATNISLGISCIYVIVNSTPTTVINFITLLFVYLHSYNYVANMLI